MRNFLATLIALAVAACLGGALFGPGEELSTGQWLGFIAVGIPTIIGIVALFGEPAGARPHGEGKTEDPRAQ